MSVKKIQFRRLLFEFLSISFAVLLALLVRQWGEDYKNNNLAKQAIVNIKEEFVENNELVSELIENHKLLFTQLDSISQINHDETLVEEIIQSLDISIMNSSAWEMAKVTNTVLYINFDDVSNLSKVYNFQAYYESIVKEYVLSNAIRQQNDNDTNQLKSTKQFLNSIIPMEEDLQQYYKIILNEILNK